MSTVGNTDRLNNYFQMTHNRGYFFACLAAFPLMAVESIELIKKILNLPVDTGGKLSIVIGKKVSSGSPHKTWEDKWQPLATLKKVVKLVLGLISTILFGWWFPQLNHRIHERLGLIDTQKTEPKPVSASTQTASPVVMSITPIESKIESKPQGKVLGAYIAPRVDNLEEIAKREGERVAKELIEKTKLKAQTEASAKAKEDKDLEAAEASDSSGEEGEEVDEVNAEVGNITPTPIRSAAADKSDPK